MHCIYEKKAYRLEKLQGEKTELKKIEDKIIVRCISHTGLALIQRAE